ncbi:MAG TPA: alpha-L-rhamnosidase C-terminal domain-containing protein, partial [Clostridia bacterium]|nr:alpha-L-rhamnosidase C-terminal domain-containing protein [Clostridia bacterium]
AVDAWFFQALAGISSIKPGYEEILIRPPHDRLIHEACPSAEASLKTVRGPAWVRWKRVNVKRLELEVEVPVNSQALVCVPTLGAAPDECVIREGATEAWRAGTVRETIKGAFFERREPHYVVWRAGSGRYHFVVER